MVLTYIIVIKMLLGRFELRDGLKITTWYKTRCCVVSIPTQLVCRSLKLCNRFSCGFIIIGGGVQECLSTYTMYVYVKI